MRKRLHNVKDNMRLGINLVDWRKLILGNLDNADSGKPSSEVCSAANTNSLITGTDYLGNFERIRKAKVGTGNV